MSGWFWHEFNLRPGVLKIQSICSEGSGLFSDLMKFTVLNESLSKQSRNVLFQRKLIGLIAKQQNEKSTKEQYIH